MNGFKLTAVLLAGIGLCGQAFAEDWHADRLRGTVLVMVGDDWAPIERGDVIADLRIIRTGANGWVTFRSGEQTVEMQPDSQIQISSEHDRDYTWILHSGGAIAADVEARDVEHFGVRTHDMVAVVKGTRFTVVAGEEGDTVSVERGTVAVSENERGLSVAVNAGQRASGGSGRLVVEGEGELSVVVDAAGNAVIAAPPAAASTIAGEIAEAQSAAPGNSGNTPGRPGEAPGNSGNAPGHSEGGPVQSSNRPGNSGNAPGHSGGGPGNSENAPGHLGDRPGNSGNAPGPSGDRPGNSGNAPGQSGDRPGNSGNAPGHSGDGPGNSANSNAGGNGKGNGNGPRG